MCFLRPQTDFTRLHHEINSDIRERLKVTKQLMSYKDTNRSGKSFGKNEKRLSSTNGISLLTKGDNKMQKDQNNVEEAKTIAGFI
jgi:hypothetical protein